MAFTGRCARACGAFAIALLFDIQPTAANAQQGPTDHSQRSAGEHAKHTVREKSNTPKKQRAKKRGHERHSSAPHGAA